jgi:Phage stabilisation protein
MRSPILGSSYVARSINAANNRMVNLYPEILPEAGKDAAFLTRCPGLRPLFTLPPDTGFPIRGMHVMNSKLYIVQSNSLWLVNADYSYTKIGYLPGIDAVRMTDDEGLLLIATDDLSFTYHEPTNTYTALNTDLPRMGSICTVNHYFVYSEINTQNIRYSTIHFKGDPTLTFDVLDRISIDGFQNNIVCMSTMFNELWIFGEISTDVYRFRSGISASGSSQSKFVRIPGAMMDIGCVARYSIAKTESNMFWVGRNKLGSGVVYKSNGYKAERISTHAIEWQLQQYSYIGDAVGYTYQQDGHTFYVLSFPLADTTFVYDVTTGAWHERASLSNGNLVKQHAGGSHVFFNNENIIRDYTTGTAYALDSNHYDDGLGRPVKWLRSWRAIGTGENNFKRAVQHNLIIDCETGVGNLTGVGESPTIALRWSDDGGHTWSTEHLRGMGKMGEYGKRVIWHRLGTTTKLRDRVYEISGSDPVKVIISGANLGMVEAIA